jgi:uncharacterized protein YjcR
MNALDESTIKEEPVGEKAGKEVMKDQSVVTGDNTAPTVYPMENSPASEETVDPIMSKMPKLIKQEDDEAQLDD